MSDIFNPTAGAPATGVRVPWWLFRTGIALVGWRHWLSLTGLCAVAAIAIPKWDAVGNWMIIGVLFIGAMYRQFRHAIEKWVDGHVGNGLFYAALDGEVTAEDIRSANDENTTPILEFLARRVGGVWATVSIESGWYVSKHISIVAILDDDLVAFENRFRRSRRIKPRDIRIQMSYMTGSRRFLEQLRVLHLHEQAARIAQSMTDGADRRAARTARTEEVPPSKGDFADEAATPPNSGSTRAPPGGASP